EPRLEALGHLDRRADQAVARRLVLLVTGAAAGGRVRAVGHGRLRVGARAARERRGLRQVGGRHPRVVDGATEVGRTDPAVVAELEVLRPALEAVLEVLRPRRGRREALTAV